MPLRKCPVVNRTAMHAFLCGIAVAPAWAQVCADYSLGQGAVFGTYNTAGDAHDVAVYGQTAYVADGGGRITKVDVQDPANPFQMNSTLWPVGGGLHVALSGSTLLWTAIPLRTFDVAALGAPVPLGVAPGSCCGSGDRIAVAGNLAFVAGAVLVLYDIADPSQPALVAMLTTDRFAGLQARAVAVAGHHAYVGLSDPWDTNGGLAVVDCSDPAAPQAGPVLHLPAVHAVDVADGVLCVGTNTGVRLFDISDPASPVAGGGVSGLNVLDVAVAGTTVYVADQFQGVKVIDVSDLNDPRILGGVPLPHVTYGVTVAGAYVYVANGQYGLRILPQHCPAATGSGDPPETFQTAIGGVWPNPTPGRTTIAFDVGRSGPHDLAVYDVTGRAVRRLVAAALRPGHHSATWDGFDSAGHAVRSGIYFIELKAPAGTRTSRVTVIR